MKNRWSILSALVLSSVACGLSSAALTGCTGDDTTGGTVDDAGGIDATPFDGSAVGDGGSAKDAAVVTEAGVGRPPWALFTLNYSDQSDLSAFSLDAGAVDGYLNYPSKYGATSIASDGPWALEQITDVVAKLDPNAPWKELASWNIRGTDDGGTSFADPFKVVAGPAGKDYVVRFERNQIAVLDTTKTGTSLLPTKFIDLSAYLDPTDEDGEIDMVSAAYVASQHRLYVLLANLDLYLVDPKGYFTLCGPTHSEIVAIDTDTDTLVSAADGGAGTAPVVLGGYNALALLEDAPRGRLLALTAGCSDPGVPDSGVAGPTHMREIDAFDFTTGLATRALDLTSNGYPSAYAVTDPTHLAIGFDFGFTANTWDVTTSALGASIDNAPDLFAYDGQGRLVGSKTNYLADGGQSVSIVATRLDDGGTTDFGAPPFRKQPAFVSAVDFWAP